MSTTLAPDVLVITDIGVDDFNPTSLSYVHHTQVMDTLRTHLYAYQERSTGGGNDEFSGPNMLAMYQQEGMAADEDEAVLVYYGCDQNAGRTLAEQVTAIKAYDGTTRLDVLDIAEAIIAVIPTPASGAVVHV